MDVGTSFMLWSHIELKYSASYEVSIEAIIEKCITCPFKLQYKLSSRKYWYIVWKTSKFNLGKIIEVLCEKSQCHLGKNILKKCSHAMFSVSHQVSISNLVTCSTFPFKLSKRDILNSIDKLFEKSQQDLEFFLETLSEK
jgi:hypothetical protein